MHTRTLFSTVLIVVLCAGLAACASSPPARPTAPAGANTIAVPDNDNSLAQQLHGSLRARGWSLIQYDPDALQDNRAYGRLAQRAQYRLTLSATRIGACRDSAPSFLYNLALIENRSGDVTLALTGASCITTATRRFEDGLDRNGLRAPNSSAKASNNPGS